MPLYKILATDSSYISVEFESRDPGTVLHRVERMKCQEADVLTDNAYSFSVNMSSNGVWRIFQRDHVDGWEGAGGFG